MLELICGIGVVFLGVISCTLTSIYEKLEEIEKNGRKTR